MWKLETRHFSMEVLPAEIWDDIMYHLSFFDLVALRKVSKLLQEVANSFIRRKYEYYEKCLKEIPKKYWISILKNQNHPEIRLDDFDSMKMHSEIWISMYRSWIGWNTLLDKIPTISEVPLSRYTSELEVSGNISFQNNSDKSFFYNMFEPNCQNVFYEIESPVDEVQFWRKGNDIRAVTYSNVSINRRKLIKKWDVISKKKLMEEAVEDTRYIRISTSLDYLYTLISRTPEFSVDYEPIFSYTLKIERLGSDLEARIIQLPEIGFIEAMHADGDRVFMLMMNEETRLMKIYTSSLKHDFKEIFSKPLTYMHGNSSIRIERPGVLSSSMFGLTIGFSVDERDWKFYDIKPHLKSDSCVHKILFHVDLLILALDFGKVRITHVEDRLESLDFETMRSITLEFPSDAVFTDLKVTEYNSKQYLIVASNGKLYIVGFNEN